MENSQKEVNIAVTPRVTLQGHLDWTGSEDGDETRVVEAKSMSDAAYNDWLHMGWSCPGLVQKYKWQLSSYMNALELPATLAVYNRLTGDLDLTAVPEPFFTTGEIKARVLEIDRFVRLTELPVACDVKIWPCPFAYLESVDYDADNFEIEDVAVAYKAAQTSEKAGKESKEKLRKVLDEVTAGANYESERVKVTYFKRNNPARFDEGLMRSAGLDPETLKRPGNSMTQVRVTLHDPDDPTPEKSVDRAARTAGT